MIPLIEHSVKAKLWDRSQINADKCSPRAGGGKRELTTKGELFGVMEIFYILIVTVLTQLHAFVKIHRTDLRTA